MNIVCIDPSLSCTAVVVNDKKVVFTSESNAMTKTGKLNKWFEVCDGHVDFRFHTLPKGKTSFAVTEIKKFEVYDSITSDIISYIESIVTPTPTKVYIEGYSFSSAAGPLIDLVTFGSLLRYKLYYTISHNITIIPPSELKLYAAKLSYPAVKEGKKDVWRNREGVAGGKFKKGEMYKALIENDSLKCEWVELLREHASDILAKTAVPKPIEDINDAKLMYEIVMSDKYI
jgi:hypothetical protein